MQNLKMTVVDFPMSYIYGFVTFGFAMMTFRSVQVTVAALAAGLVGARAPRRSRGLTDATTMNSILLGGFVGLMATGLPIAIAMCLGSLLYIWISGTIPPLTVVHRMVGGVDSFPLLAVPFFILAGALMNSAGITNRIYNFALALVGWLKGGLGHVNVIGSVIFAGMSGTAIADAGGLGTIEIKAMKDHGYPTEFALGITAASATLGPIIPPSLPMVIYGVQANVSIGKLFAGGFIPGAVMALFMMAMVAYYAHVRKYGSDIAFSWSRMGGAFFELGLRRGHGRGAVFPLVAAKGCRAGCASARCSSARWSPTSSSSSRRTWRC